MGPRTYKLILSRLRFFLLLFSTDRPRAGVPKLFSSAKLLEKFEGRTTLVAENMVSHHSLLDLNGGGGVGGEDDDDKAIVIKIEPGRYNR